MEFDLGELDEGLRFHEGPGFGEGDDGEGV